MMLIRACWFIALLCFLQACTVSRYQHAHDSTPQFQQRIHDLAEPIAIREPMSPRGNPDSYEVWGETYRVDKGLTQYQQEGIASWYGVKFHGHETSNGEIFDVYQFSAAHKSLPLPSYVRVTNLENNKNLIVRVNDRGPFHDNRLIDLSYAAAVRLGFDKKGTANVKVELVAAPLAPSEYRFIQVAAFHAEPAALNFKHSIAQLTGEPVYVTKDELNGKILHKVRIGPLEPNKINVVQDKLKAQEIHSTLVLP